MVTGTHTQSLLGTFRCAAGGNREDCRRSRRVRHRGVLFQGRIVRHRTCTERRRIRYLPAARPHGGRAGGAVEPFSVRLINTGLAQQFIIHMKTALCAGVLCASPYILYQLFRFVSPALYDNERRYVVRMVGGGYAMFSLGVLVSDFLIFPLTFRFLGTYQVSGEVDNLIALDSYISTLVMMCLAMALFSIFRYYRGCSPSWFFFSGFHAPLSETRRRDCSRNRCGYYPDIGRVHALAGCIADVGIV